jgi:hypothetical protein
MSTQRPCKPRRPSCRGRLWGAVTRNILKAASRAAERLSRVGEHRLPVEADLLHVGEDHSRAAVGPLHAAGVLLHAGEDHSHVGEVRSRAAGDRLPVEGGLSIAHDSR